MCGVNVSGRLAVWTMSAYLIPSVQSCPSALLCFVLFYSVLFCSVCVPGVLHCPSLLPVLCVVMHASSCPVGFTDNIYESPIP